MNKALLSLLGCSGSIAGILGTATLASPDTTKTIPYPEVMNLKRVPIFNAKGIVPQTAIAQNRLPQQSIAKPRLWQYKTVEEMAIAKFGCNFPGCQNRDRHVMGLATTRHFTGAIGNSLMFY